MQVTKLILLPMETNTFIINQEGSKQAIVIDPAPEYEKIERALQAEGLTPVAILLTHGHFDHIGGAQQLKQKYGAKIYIHELEKDCFNNKLNMGTNFGIPVPPGEVDHVLQDNDELSIAGIDIKVLHTPGHSPGSCCFIIEDILFSGDTLFNMTIGVTDFKGGSMEDMQKSLRRLKEEIDKDYIVHPGHNYSSSFFYEKANNPFLR